MAIQYYIFLQKDACKEQLQNYKITKCQKEGVLEEGKYERVIYVLETMENAWVQSHRKEGFFPYKSGGIYNPTKVNLTAKHVMWAVNRS